MLKTLTCITTEHDLRLVLVAAVVCLLGAVTTFRLYARMKDARGPLATVWLGFTGVVAGASVWATHFVAMLAYQPDFKTGFELPGTLLSLLVSALGMTGAFGVIAALARRSSRLAALVAGPLLAGAVATMHYTGMSAFRVQGALTWDPVLIAASLVIGSALAAAAVWFSRESRTWRAQAIGGGLFTLAVVAVHFLGMGAVTVVPDLSVAAPQSLLAAGPMVVMVITIVAFILIAALATAMIEGANQNAALTRLREAVDAMPQAMAIFDREDRCLIWNQHYADIFECHDELAAGLPFADILRSRLAQGVYPDAVGREEDWLAERLAQRRSGHVDRELETADGRWLRVEDRRTADGGTVSTCIDFTEMKRGADVLREARDAAEAANRAKSEFLANMSHEIRTPLNGVIGMAEMLERGGLAEQQHQMAATIRQSGETLNRLLGDILDLSRVESGQLEIAAEPFNLAEAVASVAALHAISARAKGLLFKLSIAPEAERRVSGDAVRIRQVVGNLVANAVKFTDKGEVSLSLAMTADGFSISVRDTGVGFDADARERIFSRFGQADGSITRRFGGTGLGLAISSQLAGLMGGALTCESTPGEGSCFTFSAPVEVLGPAVEADALPPAETFEGEPLSVLLVDDHAVNRKVVQMMLAGTGADVTVAEDGQQAVDACEQRRFDLILMDMQMPVMDGLSATQAIREREQARGLVPTLIYMLSANAAPEHLEASRAAGAARHLTKPVMAATLLAAVGEAAEARELRAAA